MTSFPLADGRKEMFYDYGCRFRSAYLILTQRTGMANDRLTRSVFVSDDGSLRLEVEQEVSRVTQGLITLTNGDQLVAPTTRKRLVKTTILLQDSQTAVIGGLLDDQKTYNQSEVPGLGSIPVLGWLFKSRNKKSTQTNLFIFITPKVIRNAADSADLTREKQLVLHETSVGHDGLGLPIMSKPKLLKPVFVN